MKPKSIHFEALEDRRLMCTVHALTQTAETVPLSANDALQFAGATPASAPLTTVSTSVLRVDAGSIKNVTDSTSKVWQADYGFAGGGISGAAGDVLGTQDDVIFNSRRWGNFSYSLPIANGNYTLKLYFVDALSTRVGQRTFDVKAENVLIQNDLDIFARVGKNTALVTSNSVSITDGKLDLSFISPGNLALVSGIELLKTTSAPTIAWSSLAAAPVPRAEALRAVVGNKLYVFGGFSGNDGPVVRSDVFDPATNAWKRIADLPQRMTHTGVAVVGRNVYFAGGYIGVAPGYNQVYGSKKVWKYNVDTNAFTALPDLPIERAGGGLVEINGILHYFGGDNLARHDVGDHYVFNIATGTSWTSAAPLPNPRSHMGYLGLGGKIYAIAGQIGNDAALTTLNIVSRYDPATNSWTSLAQLPIAVSHISSATFIWNGKILVTGGETAHNVPSAQVYMYDPSTNIWSQLTNLPAPRFSGVADIINGVLYFTGGSSTTTTWKGVLS